MTPLPLAADQPIMPGSANGSHSGYQQKLNDLYTSGADGLYVTLKEENLHPERKFLLQEEGVEYFVDIAIPCRKGTVAIAVTDRPAPQAALREPNLQAVCEAVARLGGERTDPASD